MDGATLVIVPVLRRPHRVAPLLESLAASTPEPHRVLFVATAGDLEEIAAISAAGADLLVVPPNPQGDYATKINTAVRESAEPYLFTGADDLLFHPGWLSKALACMVDGIGVVGTNDLGNERVMEGRHSTHSLVSREYVERFGTIDERGKIFHEGYWHEFCDDELIGTAKARNAFAPCLESVVEHLHCNWGKAPMDELYNEQPQRMRIGRKVFRRRQHLWQGLSA